jgi:hypothetical protein
VRGFVLICAGAWRPSKAWGVLRMDSVVRITIF